MTQRKVGIVPSVRSRNKANRELLKWMCRTLTDDQKSSKQSSKS